MLKKLSYAKLLVCGFVAVIALGTVLLCLPLAARTGTWTSPLDSAFTAVSATCVTGLSVFDTWEHWSLFGQLVILLLIQIGGLGFMTVIGMFSLLMKRHFSMRERRLLMQSAGNTQYDGTITLIRRILLGTLLIESLGAALLLLRFAPRMGFWAGLYNAVFHAVSAFCNAGFDLMGKYGAGLSLSAFSGDVAVNLTLAFLIVTGGIGFLVWDDVLKNRHHLRRYSLHSKIVLTTTAVLLLGGWLLFYCTERNGAFAGMPAGKQVLAALFQSVTTRTAGFFTVDQGTLSAAGLIVTCVLMFIGGSPGSTAGGIKTTTVATVLISTVASCCGQNEQHAFKKQLDREQVRQATSIVAIYFSGMLLSLFVMSLYEPFPLQSLLYEIVSAIGTVGLSTGITASLSAPSQCILMFLMFAGRIGGLTFVLAVAERRKRAQLDRPTEKILIG